ncbi:MAG: hypothetical protein SFY32_07915 [Bacteroidota bacterium]|nr:hypothetical protein [Bacteroidota bacterium]
MLKIKIFTVLVALKTLLCGCDKTTDQKFQNVFGNYRISRVGTLNSEIDESSGLILADKDSLFYTHNDGNIKHLFKINAKGEIIKKINLNGHFGDVEDIAKDDSGNVFICDVGNNFNDRPNLFIHKFNPETNQYLDTVRFFYPDQKAFPPSQKEMNFDCEAVFYFKDSLYLFSKNRGNRMVNLYQLPVSSSKKFIPAKAIDKSYIKAEVTAADINPSKTKFVLLTYGYIYVYKIENNKISFSKPLTCRKFGRGGQLEAICFINDDDMLITNEGGKIWKMEIKD